MARTITLKCYLDEGVPGPEHFAIVESPMPVIGDGVLVELLAISADPYMRPRLRTNWPGGIKEGQPMSGFVSGRIIESKLPEWKAGDLFGASLPYTDVQAVSAKALKQNPFRKLTGLINESQISLGIGVLGMPGSTAYGGLIEVLRPKKGETIWVSGAAGAVGSMVGQLAKQVYGCTVIGSAGGPDKCRMVKEKFGFDHCIDYKLCQRPKDLIVALREVVPKGIDMYFENVGGMHFEAAMSCLRIGGRIAVCGIISQLSDKRPEANKIHIANMIYSKQRIEGFECGPWLSGQRGSFLTDMAAYMKDGKVKIEETFFDGMDSFGAAFQSLFVGGNVGKVVLRTGRMPAAKL
eukprot:TRINITY_DN57182_c0_g1_i1.p1 TRINITY_DN57182_c0_g1~~TRINITY_DN57182_c0_g1_i1.p1  ORF type:complete len:350 (-),score=57.59 TRINITY_DN57182_c0_g1_i1:169-1218(-)